MTFKTVHIEVSEGKASCGIDLNQGMYRAKKSAKWVKRWYVWCNGCKGDAE